MVVEALAKRMFPDGLDLDVMRPPWANDTPVSQSEVHRFIDDAKAKHKMYSKLTKPPKKGGVTYDLEVGVSLVVRLTNELLADYKDRLPNNPGTFTGDGRFLSARFHQMIPQVEQLSSVLIRVNQLLKIIKNCAPNDIGDFRSLEEADVHEVERRNQDILFSLLTDLWLAWKIGYGIPRSCITDKEADQGLFSGWRNVSWSDYLTSAFFFFDTEQGYAFASSTAKGMWGKEKDSVLKRLRDDFTSAETEQQVHQDKQASPPPRQNDSLPERLMSLVPRVIADPESPDHRAQLLDHLQPTKKGRRNTRLAAKRTPDDEEFFNQKITRIRPVKLWRCNSDRCTHPLDQARIPDTIDTEGQHRGSTDTRRLRNPRFKKGHRSVFDRYICPAWWQCSGLLVPIFDDNVRT